MKTKTTTLQFVVKKTYQQSKITLYAKKRFLFMSIWVKVDSKIVPYLSTDLLNYRHFESMNCNHMLGDYTKAHGDDYKLLRNKYVY